MCAGTQQHAQASGNVRRHPAVCAGTLAVRVGFVSYLLLLLQSLLLLALHLALHLLLLLHGRAVQEFLLFLLDSLELSISHASACLLLLGLL